MAERRVLQTPSVPKQTSPPKTCAFCKRLIEPEQRPAVQLPNGDEIHPECWLKHEESERKKKVN